MSGGTLFVVATPIGNLSDVTFRSLEVLRAVPLVAAEDTRLTRRLLDRYEIAVRTVSYYAQSAPARETELLEHLRGGADLALVSDAGTPLVSDPGEGLVAAWAGEGGRVVPIPGASSVMAAVAASGVAGPRWSFEGFLPRSGRDRRVRLARIAADERGCVLFEAPSRVAATLRDLTAACGADRPAAVCRELTKLHEEIRRGTLGELAAADMTPRGEFVIVVGSGLSVPDAASPRVTPHEAAAEVDRLVADGMSRAAAARAVSAWSGIPRRVLYAGSDRTRADGDADRRVEPGGAGGGVDAAGEVMG